MADTPLNQTLTAAIGTIDDDNGLPETFPDDYSFQWIRINGSTETEIPGATAHTYTYTYTYTLRYHNGIDERQPDLWSQTDPPV